MSLFIEWNSLLLQNYFSPAHAGQNVWIPTTNVELESIGFHIGGAAGLIEAVKQGPNWLNNNENIAVKAHSLVTTRFYPSSRPSGYCDPGKELDVYKGSKAPTYLPYIALWVLAHSESTKGDGGFYQKVSQLIDMTFPNNVGGEMKAVWIDLQYWSVDESGGRFGRFNFNVLGAHRFVGMAYAQAMITGRDIEGINRLFGSCKLQPGQNLDQNNSIQLLEHGEQASYLSKGLKAAMGEPKYRDQLTQMLKVRLEFWDGAVPKNTIYTSTTSTGYEEPLYSNDNETSIILQMKTHGGAAQWQIGWRVPAVVTGLNYSLKVGEGEFTKAKLELYGTHFNCITGVDQTNARSVLDYSAKNNIDAILKYAESDGTESDRKFYIFNKKIRVLTWDSPDPSLSDALLEREIPLKGPVYLMFSKLEYANLELILKNEEIEHEFIDDVGGLPDHWELICITETEKLSLEQRATITEEEYLSDAKARIRFVGGKSISGLGGKKYEYYDLPIVELEGPVDAEIYADGLSFERLGDDEDNDASIRRYKFSLDDGSGSAFKVNVRIEGELVCTVGLQVLKAGGLASAQQANFSIDKFGKNLTNESGLRGAFIGQDLSRDLNLNINYFEVNKVSLSSSHQLSILEIKETNISCLFLDSVASTRNGSMTFGVARDQIRRLAYNLGIGDIEPGLLVHDLRRRGHIEIETNLKGHMVSIKSVPPTLYSLPIKNGNEFFYGICGSLRLAQWTKLAEASDLNLYVVNALSGKLPVVRVGANESKSIREIASSANFQQLALPSGKISQWSGSIQEIEEDLAWYSDRGSSPVDLNKLTAGKGIFNEAKEMMVNSALKYELFRYEDPQIPGMRIYKLGRKLVGGDSKFSFIPDSRWGVWAALGAFADFVKQNHDIDDASPWPFHYESATGYLWLPARIEPPFVVARALALCSGDGPIIIDVSGESDGESILLRCKNSRIIGKVSRAYFDMQTGKWLCYQWVPKEIAHHIAGLLGGELKEI